MAQVTKKKLVLIGHNGIGKTSLSMVLSGKEFIGSNDFIEAYMDEHTLDPIAVDNQLVELTIRDSVNGHPDYRSLRPLSYIGCEVLVICFSIEKPESADYVVENVYPEVCKYSDAPKLLVALKSDLRHDDKIEDLQLITQDMGRALATQIGAISYVECSAKTKTHLVDLLEQAARISLTFTPMTHKRKSCLLL